MKQATICTYSSLKYDLIHMMPKWKNFFYIKWREAQRNENTALKFRSLHNRRDCGRPPAKLEVGNDAHQATDTSVVSNKIRFWHHRVERKAITKQKPSSGWGLHSNRTNFIRLTWSLIAGPATGNQQIMEPGQVTQVKCFEQFGLRQHFIRLTWSLPSVSFWVPAIQMIVMNCEIAIYSFTVS